MSHSEAQRAEVHEQTTGQLEEHREFQDAATQEPHLPVAAPGHGSPYLGVGGATFWTFYKQA